MIQETGFDGVSLIKHFEACSLEAYPDPATGGHPWTIGYGHTGAEVRQGESCSLAEAETVLMFDLDRFERGIERLVTRRLEARQFDALVSLAFNIGLGNLASSTLLKKLNMGDDIAAAAQFLAWNRAAGKVMKGLQRRRKAESLVFTGYPASVAIEHAMKVYP
jgi:lysozyme